MRWAQLRYSLTLWDRSKYLEPLALEPRCVIGLLLPEQLHISTEHHFLPYTNISRCLDGLPALSHVSSETERRGNINHTIVHLASWDDITAVKTVLVWLCSLFPAHIAELTKCFDHFRLISALWLCFKVDTLMQMRFDKHLESYIFGQAPFVCGQAAPSEVFLKDICFLRHSTTFSARWNPWYCFPQ